MQIVSTQVQSVGNLVGTREVAMGIAPAAAAMILNNMIKQYSNPYVAVLREYTSNARDSHKAAGVTRPVEVSLPSDLSPQLVIEDFGLGLSAKELELYGQFGESDKRDSNDKIGGFGLGSKSGLAIAAQFIVTAVKDGKRNTVVVTRREDGHPIMSFFDEQDATGESNGVKITISTPERHKFVNAIENNFFLGWEPGSILVDGMPVEQHLSVHTPEDFTELDGLGWKLQGKGHLKARNISRGGTALIDAVKYEIDLSQVEGLDDRTRRGFLDEVVIKLENGSVEMHPSRESLIYDKRTRDYIQQQINKLVEVGKKQYQGEVEAAATIREAILARRKAISFGFGAEHEFSWGGKPIDLTFPKDTAGDELRKVGFSEASITHNYRGNARSDYTTNRQMRNYHDVLTNQIDRIAASDNYVLVHSAEDPTKVRNRTLHKETNGAVMWAETTAYRLNAIKDKDGNYPHAGVRPTHFTILYTSLPLRKINKWLVGAFAHVYSAKDYTEVVTAARKEAARISREENKLYGVVKKVPSVRVMTSDQYSAYGRASYRDVDVTDIDPKGRYVLLKTGESDFIDQAKECLLTQRGFENYRGLNAILRGLLLRGWSFVLANKNTNTAKYDDLFPNLRTDLREVIAEEARGSKKLVSDYQRRLVRDRVQSRFNWTKQFETKHLRRIGNTATRQWIQDMREADDAMDALTQALKDHGEYLKFPADLYEEPVVGGDSYGLRYPLLGSLGYKVDWEEVVLYINQLDLKFASV